MPNKRILIKTTNGGYTSIIDNHEENTQTSINRYFKKINSEQGNPNIKIMIITSEKYSMKLINLLT